MKLNADARKKAAEERQKERSKRTDAEQLALLDQRFGKGQGAVKERARLLSLLPAITEDETPEEVVLAPKPKTTAKSRRAKQPAKATKAKGT